MKTNSRIKHHSIFGCLIGAIASLGLLGFSSAQAAPFAYSADGDANPSTLYRIDLTTNAISTVGTITGFEVESLSFGPGPVLYGIDEDGSQLLSINTSTAAPTVVGALGASVSDPGMAYCTDNSTMYLASEDGELYTINLSTGAATLVGTDATYSPTGMTCSTGGVLYVIDDSDDNLYTVNRGTGTSTLVGSLGVSISDGGMARNGSQLLMVSDNSPTNLYQVNPSTGAASIIVELDSSSLSLESLSVDTEATAPASSPAVPTPALSVWGLPLLIALMPVIGLFANRRRKKH